MSLIRNIFRKQKNKVTARVSSFRTGIILKVYPASRSHVKNPYYVEILYFNQYAKVGEIIMTTNIPGEHKLDMIVGSNWEYHYPRLEIIGYKTEFEYLLYNQELK